MTTKSRVALITAGFLTLLTLILLALWLTIQEGYLREEAGRKVLIATGLMAEVSRAPLRDGRILELAQIADRASATPEISRVMVADRTGEILVDSEHVAYGESPEIAQRALRSGRVLIVPRQTRWTGAVRVQNPAGDILGAVVMDYPSTELLAARRQARSVGALVALLGIGIGATLAFLAAELLTRPLRGLLAGIRQVQSGGRWEPIPVSGTPEFAEISKSFNEMASVIRMRVEHLESLNQLSGNLPLAMDLQEAATMISYSTKAMLSARSYLWISDPFLHELIHITTKDEEAFLKPAPVMCECPVGKVYADRSVIIVGDGSSYPSGSEIVAGLRVRSAAVLPLATPDGLAGVLAIVDPHGRSYVTESDSALAVTMANIAAPAVMSLLRTRSQARAAETLQALLVPATVPPVTPDMAVHYSPAEQMAGLGGDYYDFIALDTTRWAVVVGDASGKGLDAARYTATAKYVIRSHVLEYQDPAEALYWSNRTLSWQDQSGRFMTAFCCILDIREHILTYSGAGHVPPLLYRIRTGKVQELAPEGPVLGITGASFPNTVIDLDSGDVLCMYTDGVSEARRSGELFGQERLARILSANALKPSTGIMESILTELESYAERGLRDDVVIVILKIP